MTIKNFAQIFATNFAVLGTDRNFISPAGTAPTDVEALALWGDNMIILEKDLADTLGADPAVLPAISSDLENELVALTGRSLQSAFPLGYNLPKTIDPKKMGDTKVWNAAVTDFSKWLIENAVEEVATSEEQVAEPLTAAEAEAVVEAIADTPAGDVALENAVAVAEAETGLAMSEESAIAYLSGKQILNAQKASHEMVGVAEQKVNDAVEALLDAAKLLRGSNALSGAIIAKLEAPLLEETITESEEVPA